MRPWASHFAAVRAKRPAVCKFPPAAAAAGAALSVRLAYTAQPLGNAAPPQRRTCSLAGSGKATRANIGCGRFAAATSEEAPPPPYNSSTASRIRHLVVIDLTDRVVPYEIAWAAQHALLQHQMLQLESHKTKAKEEPKSGSYLELLPGIAPCRVSGETACDFAILTQHPSVYTLGQGSSLSFVAADMRDKESQLKLPLELQQDVQDASQVAKALGDLASAIAALRAPERGDLKGPSEGAPGLVGAPQKGRMRDGRGPPQLLRVERGGQVTWHGPGQLVVYPIFDLRKHQTDIRAFIDALETTAAQSLVRLWQTTHPAAASLLQQKQNQQKQKQQAQRHQNQRQNRNQQEQIQNQQEQRNDAEAEDVECLSQPFLHLRRCRSMPGVWAGGRKVCAVGIRLRRWISYHGIALNISNSLEPYKRIVPCGLVGKEATNACEWIRFLLQQVQQLQQHEEHQQITQELQHGLQQHETVQSHSSLLPIAATCVVEALRQTFGFTSLSVTKDLQAALQLASRMHS
ncbi:uncharacterized protein LOC113147208 [Cyclospora cayetanensis]|uniref:Uncharacterized protein LOC113147208 n=1 Tax=Cyclospora cayetanensis TaxID=88456 RepID=A0A6P6RXY5_9EIME|nr:uncharacterized protein LOC113147208 [Cyclospora cayetanensis]